MQRPFIDNGPMADLTLTAVTRTQGSTQALKDGTSRPRHVDLQFEEVPVLIQAFRRMVRSVEWDVCEMAFTTYLVAKEHGKPFTALPVFLVRGFHHGAILRSVTADGLVPKDLEGRKSGVNRGYTVTTGVWARGILADEHGVDLSRVTWVLSGDEHVAEYQPPPNVIPAGPGEDVPEMVASGELAAGIGIPADYPELVPLIPTRPRQATARCATAASTPSTMSWSSATSCSRSTRTSPRTCSPPTRTRRSATSPTSPKDSSPTRARRTACTRGSCRSPARTRFPTASRRTGP